MESVDMRLQELEIKCSFLEKELNEWKEASRELYSKVNQFEQLLRKWESLRDEDMTPMSPTNEQLGYQPPF